jgi:membrane-associated phospholipid phosphatase
VAVTFAGVIRCMRNTLNSHHGFSANEWLRNKSISLLIAALLAWPLTIAAAFAQDDGPAVTAAASGPSASAVQASLSAPETNATLADSDPRVPAADPGVPQGNANGTGATHDSDISWKHLPMRVLQDQKNLWLFPTQLARGRHWVPTLAIAGVTGALIATDPHDEPYFRNNSAFEETSEIFSTTNTEIVEIGFPAAVYLTGLLRHDSYTEQTAILAAEAYVDSVIPNVVIKDISRRLRPSAVPPNRDFRDTFFQSGVTVVGKGSSFPSGHATAAFSIATVMARRYGEHKWVPWVAYSVAALISLSRISDMAHFPSDVFLGAALGYTITRFDVFRDRIR